MKRKIKSVKYKGLVGECTEDHLNILWYFYDDVYGQQIISENFILQINESEKNSINKSFEIEYILDELRLSLYDFIREAERQGKWIQSNYDRGIVFTPKKLREKIDNNQFVWGLCNWDLIDPLEYLSTEIDNVIKKLSETKTIIKPI